MVLGSKMMNVLYIKGMVNDFYRDLFKEDMVFGPYVR